MLDQGRFIMDILNEERLKLTEEQSKIGESLIARMTLSFFLHLLRPLHWPNQQAK